MKIKKRIGWYILGSIAFLVLVFFVWQWSIKVPTTGDWPPELAVLATADFNGNLATVHNVRNFRYNGSEDPKDIQINYYDKTYDLSTVTKVWYITEPFTGFKAAAHTFLSFQFANGDFLSITIEARERPGQSYSLYKGLLHTYPLLYIPADERDVVFLRANIRKSNVYMYPVKLSKPENGGILLKNMLLTMNDLVAHPAWYNTIWSNCTSNIAYQVDKVVPGRLSLGSWQLALTGYADELAYKAGLLDTNLTLDQARTKYNITPRSQEIGDVDDYSNLIRQFGAN